MKLEETYIDELIAKYLAGEASPEEAILLDDWKNESKDNEAYFMSSSKIWQQSAHHPIDTSALYERIRVQAKLKKTPFIFTLPTLSPLRIAASLLILSSVGIAFYLFNKNGSQPEKTITANTLSISEQLADGSTVTMRKQSKLTLLSGFNAKQRKLKLEGEAYFEVIHNAEKPFIIDAGGIEITDIGTAFNVKANPLNDTVTIAVTEGIVSLQTRDTSMQVVAHQTGLYVRSRGTLQLISSVNPNSFAYRTKKFQFTVQRLSDVLAALNEVYEQQYNLTNDHLGDCLITVEFNNESPETIADIISETLGISYRKTANGFLFLGNTCVQ